VVHYARYIISAPASINVSTVGIYAWLAFASAIAGVVVYFCALMSSHLAAFRVEVGLQKVGMKKIMSMPLVFLTNTQAAKCEKLSMTERNNPHFFGTPVAGNGGYLVSPLF
jgi:ATP-binding cassette subfamily B protein